MNTPSWRRQHAAAGGALHLDVHPPVQALAVEEVVARCQHARCWPAHLRTAVVFLSEPELDWRSLPVPVPRRL